MAKNDFYFYRAPEGGNPVISSLGLGAAQSFDVGEPVIITGGLLEEAAGAPDPATVDGIAAGSTQGKDANGIAGTVPTGTPITYYSAHPEQLFITERWATGGAGGQVAPTAGAIGSTAGFHTNGTNWSLDTAVGNNTLVEVVDVLDTNKQSLSSSTQRTTGTGVHVVFKIL